MDFVLSFVLPRPPRSLLLLAALLGGVPGVLGGTAAAEPAVVIRTEKRILPGGRPHTEEVVRSCWDRDPVDHERNLGERAEVTPLSGGALFESRVGKILEARMVSQAKGSVDEYGDEHHILDQTANSWLPAPGSAVGFPVEFLLDGSHDLGKIVVSTAYQWTRTKQKYDTYTSSDRGASWTKLASVNSPNENLHPLSGWFSRFVTEEDASDVMAREVDSLKFVFRRNDPVKRPHAESVYSEIAIYGSEP